MEYKGKHRAEIYQDINNASLYEPRIDYIKNLLEKMLPLVELEKDGRAVKVDGFRLKNLKDWMTPSSCDPIEVFGYAGSRCNISCAFCYNRGNPPTLALGNLQRPPELEYGEMMTRLRYLNPKGRRSLFTSLGDIYEVLAHPRILDILRPLRQTTDKPFRITTNGLLLTPTMIQALAELKPVYLYISVNSVLEAGGSETMDDGAVGLSAKVLIRLRESGIPYALVMVPWPVKNSMVQSLDAISATAEMADRCGAHLLEVNLPGYTRCFSEMKLFGLEEVWSEAVAHVRRLREGISTPIVAMPAMYEENLFEEEKNLPSIMGTISNSPAERAGIEAGDVITKIGGINIMNRPQARDILSLGRDREKVSITLERRGEEVTLELETGSHGYPYSPLIDPHLGVITLGTGLRMSYLEDLKSLIDHRGARRVLFFSSALVKPLFEQMLSASPLFAGPGIELDIVVPANRFLGGNIFMGDLLVVQDFIDAARSYLGQSGSRPDLIVIPSSPFNLSPWGRDLTGRCYLEIERAIGVPVALLRCDTIYD